jgi:hypothetical protein
LGTSLGIKDAEEWNNVDTKIVIKNGGYFVNAEYKGSLAKGTKAGDYSATV